MKRKLKFATCEAGQKLRTRLENSPLGRHYINSTNGKKRIDYLVSLK